MRNIFEYYLKNYGVAVDPLICKWNSGCEKRNTDFHVSYQNYRTWTLEYILVIAMQFLGAVSIGYEYDSEL